MLGSVSRREMEGYTSSTEDSGQWEDLARHTVSSRASQSQRVSASGIYSKLHVYCLLSSGGGHGSSK